MLKTDTFLAFLLVVAVAAPQKFVLGQDSSMFAEYRAVDFKTLSTKPKISVANYLIDELMTQINTLVKENGYDPVEIPDVHKNFKKWFFHGELDMDHGSAWGISNVYRDGDVMTDYTNGILTLDASIKFPKIMFNYDFSAKFMNLGPAGTIEGSANDIQMSFSLTFNAKDLILTLNNFNISKIGDIYIKFLPGGFVKWLMNILTSWLIAYYKDVIIGRTTKFIVQDILVIIIEQVNNELSTYAHYFRLILF